MTPRWPIEPPLKDNEKLEREYWRDCFGQLHWREVIVENGNTQNIKETGGNQHLPEKDK